MKKLPIILTSIGVMLVCSYFAGVWYFQDHFLPTQTIQGVNVGLTTATEAITLIDTAIAEQEMKIEVVDNTVGLDLGTLGVTIDSTALAEQTLAGQQTWLWPFAFVQVEATQTQEYQINQEVMKQALFNAGITNPEGKVAASNATIEKTETNFALTTDVSGTVLNPDKTYELVAKAVAQGEDSVSVVDARELPSVQAEQLQPVIDTANKMSANDQILTVREETITIPAKQIFAWVNIVDNETVVIDEAAISSYVQAFVNDYTVMATARTLDTTTMQQSGGIEGSTIAVGETTKALVAAIKSEKKQTTPATLSQISSPTHIQGVGETYVQISIQDQHLWYYQNGKLVLESAVITGDETQGWGTITGVYSIQAKERDAVLEGYSYGWDYSVPVKYWMPIYSDGTGIHDASWHSTFGGTIYRGGGSHGCVNLPPAIAEQLFNSVSVGTPVVIYQ